MIADLAEQGPVARTTRATEVAEDLRRMILAGELVPGERLRQADVAARFGVSTTPVREAFTALARQGLLRHDVHRGAVVFPPTPADIQENLEIRIALEPLAASLAANTITAEQLEMLAEVAEQLGVCVNGSRDPLEYNLLDRDFHGTIHAAARRPRLAEMIESLRDAADTYLHLRTLRPDDDKFLPLKQTQHKLIVAALGASDGYGAARLAEEHLRVTAEQARLAVASLAEQASGAAHAIAEAGKR